MQAIPLTKHSKAQTWQLAENIPSIIPGKIHYTDNFTLQKETHMHSLDYYYLTSVKQVHAQESLSTCFYSLKTKIFNGTW